MIPNPGGNCDDAGSSKITVGIASVTEKKTLLSGFAIQLICFRFLTSDRNRKSLPLYIYRRDDLENERN